MSDCGCNDPCKGGESGNPAEIFGSSLIWWHRADQGVTLNGNQVSAWADQTANGLHLVQPVAANQPLFVPNVVAGLPGIYRDNPATNGGLRRVMTGSDNVATAAPFWQMFVASNTLFANGVFLQQFGGSQNYLFQRTTTVSFLTSNVQGQPAAVLNLGITAGQRFWFATQHTSANGLIARGKGQGNSIVSVSGAPFVRSVRGARTLFDFVSAFGWDDAYAFELFCVSGTPTPAQVAAAEQWVSRWAI